MPGQEWHLKRPGHIIWAFMGRILTILFVAVFAIGELLPGGARGGIVCLGGGHEHGHGITEDSLLDHCAHGIGLVHSHSEDHDEHCHCTDVQVLGVAVVLPSRSDDAPVCLGVAPPTDGWLVLIGERGLGSAGLPRAPPWFDPGREQRLSMVASFRLTI